MGNSLGGIQLAVRDATRQTELTEETVCNHPHYGDLPTLPPGHYFFYSILQPEHRAYFSDESTEIGRGDRDREGMPSGQQLRDAPRVLAGRICWDLKGRGK